MLIMLNSLAVPLKADEDVFAVKDNATRLEETFDSYREAVDYYEEKLEEYDNLLLYINDRLIMMEYGIVQFNTDEACSLEIDYYSTSKNEDDLINGCYGIDAAYLKTDYDKDRVYFMVSNDIGYTSMDNVILRPFEKIETGLSVYQNHDRFTHNIMSQLDHDFYSYSIDLDDRLDFLSEGDFYSYDGHYFYDDFRTMIDDYRNDTRENSISETPYYNYYQYLPHRSITNYSSEELNSYINESLAINGRLARYDDSNLDSAADEVNRSELYGNIEDFFIAESLYGTNAMMLISSAMYESSYGRSLSSYSENNLYLSSAHLGEADSADSRYDSVADSIYAHSRYFISARYSNHRRSDYYGTFYGNKVSGINVNYSPDQYFGEKCASMYYLLDYRLGNRDRNDRALGIITDKDSVTFYHDEELNSRWFTLSDISEMSFVILGEYEGSYLISIDNSFNDDYEYDFDESVAYISKDSFSCTLNEDRIRGYDLSYVHYDLSGGQICGYSEIDLFEGCNPKPYKEHYEYIGTDENNTAQYKYIEAIDLIKSFNNVVELGKDIDLNSSLLRVFYEDSTYRDVEVNTDMISGYDRNSEGEQNIRITYNGVSIDKKITVSSELKELRSAIDEAIENKDYQFVKNNLPRLKYQLSFDQIRNIDRSLNEADNRNYYIEDRTRKHDISISGLDLALSEMSGLRYFGDTYYVILRNAPFLDADALKKHSEGYDFEVVDSHNISFRFNFENIELLSPVIVQIDIPDKRSDMIYSVYHLARNGDVIKMRTTQSDNYIQYMAKESGSYVILSRPSVNEYHIADTVENLSYENMGIDNHRNNYRLFAIGVISLIGIIGIVLYYVMYNRNERLWKEFRRSLPTQGIVQEEKPKS